VIVPEGLAWWRGEPGGAEWLERLPGLVARCAEVWSLDLETPFEPAHISLVVPVQLAGGVEAVLKVNFPDDESEHEPDALEHWDGCGAVRLLARDDSIRALLIERLRPGTQLWSLPETEANEVAAGLLRRIWRAPPEPNPFQLVADAAAWWAEGLPKRWERCGRPFERDLLDFAVAFLREAAERRSDLVIVHQDFHGGNVLRASREPWLAIDPKPLAGEREFDTAALLRDRRWELGCDLRPHRMLTRRLDELAAALDLDRERMRGWGVAHTLAWAFERDRVLPDHIECARLLAAIR
jgi:streptomycin 6-kinase